MNSRRINAKNDIEVYKPINFMEKYIIPTKKMLTNPNNKDAFL